MLESDVRAALRDLPLGGLRVFQQVRSTNDVALAWAEQAAPDFSLVLADEQTAGRGRSGRSWHTPPGRALAFSIIIRPRREEVAWAARLAGLGCLAVTDAVAQLGLRCAIKWPNDILVGGKKVAGVLVESVWIGQAWSAAVLGIGLNVLRGSAPNSGVLFPPTTLESELGSPPDRSEVLRTCISALLRWRGELGSDLFWKTWQDRLAYLGQSVRLSAGQDEELEGLLVGLRGDGSLALQCNGGILYFQAGEMHLRPGDDRML